MSLVQGAYRVPGAEGRDRLSADRRRGGPGMARGMRPVRKRVALEHEGSGVGKEIEMEGSLIMGWHLETLKIVAENEFVAGVILRYTIAEIERLRLYLKVIEDEAPKRNLDWCRRIAKEALED